MNNSEQEQIYRLALHFIPKVGSVYAKQLISYCGSAEAVFSANKAKLLKVPGIGVQIAETILKQKSLFVKQAQQEWQRIIQQNIQLLHYTDAAYPQLLKMHHDAPALLYFKGNADLNRQRNVAIVGTRHATDYGKRLTEELVIELKKYNCTIVSGLAYGIDIVAHRSAVAQGMTTIGVMGSSVDIVYPAAHKKIAQDMMLNGGLISENPLGTKPDAHLFPARNRIVAGMVEAVIVIEAAKRSGALITANIAHSYNKEIFALPGNVHQAQSEGCNKLIKDQKALLITSAEDIAQALGWELYDKQRTIKPTLNFENELDLSEAEKNILRILQKNGNTHIDTLLLQSQLPADMMASLLLQLEFQGYVKALPGKLFGLSL